MGDEPRRREAQAGARRGSTCRLRVRRPAARPRRRRHRQRRRGDLGPLDQVDQAGRPRRRLRRHERAHRADPAGPHLLHAGRRARLDDGHPLRARAAAGLPGRDGGAARDRHRAGADRRARRLRQDGGRRSVRQGRLHPLRRRTLPGIRPESESQMRVCRVLIAALLAAGGLVAGTTGSIAATPTAAPSNISVTFNKVVGGFTRPVSVTSARGGSRRLFVVQQQGTVRAVKKGVVQRADYLNLSPEVLCCDEQGLLSITFHRNFRAHPFVYAAYTRSDAALQVSRFRASSASALSVARSTEVRLFSVPHHADTPNHNGGQLMFGRGGLLYVTTGDGGGSDDPYRNAERLTSLSGKILRIDVDHWCGGHHYCIPPSNPFPHATNANKRLVYHWGLRNPWRASVDRADGSLWIGDVGQNAWEEIDHVGSRAGIDFGWSCMEGRVPDANGASCTGRQMRGPVTVYDHSNNRAAVIGGYAYHGSSFPCARGLYVFADYSSGETWVLGRTKAGGYPRARVATFSGSLSGFGEGDGGEIYAVDLGGSLWHVVFHRR